MIDYIIEIDGQSFDAVDLLKTLDAVRYGGRVPSRKMSIMLMENQVIDESVLFPGAAKGPKFTSFRNELREQFEILRGIGYDPPV